MSLDTTQTQTLTQLIHKQGVDQMQSNHVLTVKDVLQRPHFAKAEVVAGKQGLDRPIRWVHVLEVTHFDTLIHGQEMILSTGVGLREGQFSETYYLKKLIAHGASCLCLELGDYIDGVKEEMIDMANEHHFPLIVFREVVRFVDITQDLHSLIINRHHQTLQKLDSLSREFHKLTLGAQGTHQILKLLHTSTGAQVVYIPVQGTAQFVPPMKNENQEKVKQQLLAQYAQLNREKKNATLRWTDQESKQERLFQSVEGMGKTWGILVLMFKERVQEEFNVLVLDRAALAIAQDLLRRLYTEERKLHAEHVWVDDLIHHRIHSENQAASLLGQVYRHIRQSPYHVCIIKMIRTDDQTRHLDEDEWESTRYQTSLLVRHLFEKFGFYPLITTKENQLIILAVDTKTKASQKGRLQQIFQSLKNMQKDSHHSYQLNVGVGRPYTMLTDAHLSYNEAQQVLHLIDLNLTNVSLFYQDIGIYRLLLNIEDLEVIQAFIEDYIGALIRYDQDKNGELLHTLKVYLQQNCSKHAAAQELHIARQTLYHRLSKINGLLEMDCTSPKNRLPIEVAITAYELAQRT